MPVVNAAGRSLYYEWVEGDALGMPTLVFLHEGLGSVRQWRDFPAKVVAATGCSALVYDRYGHGQSEVLQERRRSVRFMHDEALVSLPDLRRALGLSDVILVGHSDGASIALIHSGAGHPVRALVVMAPHVFIERICLTAIESAKESFETTDFPERLGRHHRDARKTFYGWADVWTDENFESWDIREEYLPNVPCPVLALQGYDDAYGTMAQLDELARTVGGSCELVRLENCGHSPFRDQPEATLEALARFIDKTKQ